MKNGKRFINRMTGHKLNNQGSTLLTVIICIAFISILASLMLSVTMTNLQMKIVESKSRDNFYSCETVMEKIRTASQEIASEAVKYVYENDVLKSYASYLVLSEEDRNEQIQEKVAARFLRTVGTVDEDMDYDEVVTLAKTSGIPLKLTLDDDTGVNYFYTKNYVSSDEYSMFVWPDRTAPALFCEKLGDTYAIRMKDVTIRYVKEDYQTAITTDIVITLPKFSFTAGEEDVHYSMAQPYKQYVLLADNAVSSDNIAGTTNIQGNVYAGAGGIRVNGRNSNTHTVNMNGGTIVTRGNILVSDTAKLNIGTEEVPAVIWAGNLNTDTSAAYPSGSLLTTDLKINGISIIKDDLTLDGANSNVQFQSGAYIGYTGTHSPKGSSMIINGSGPNTSLNLSGLSELILAGRAHVSVQDMALNKDADILTGESLAFKSNQRAYLLPSQFITNVLHNPVTEEDFTDPLIGTPAVTIDDTEEAIKYNDYVAATPYKIAAKQTGDTTLRYYYLNFASGWQADSYFKSFFQLYPEALNSMAPFRLASVTLPSPGTVLAAGNMMSYDALGVRLTPGLSDTYAYPGGIKSDRAVDDAIAGTTLGNSIYDTAAVKGRTVGSLDALYSKISHLLSTDSTKAYNETDQTVASSIKAGGVSYIIDNDLNLSSAPAFDDYNRFRGDAVFSNTDPSTQSFWVVDGNVTINPSAVFNGFLIATGDITIGAGAQLNGLLISTGEKGSAVVTAGNNVTLKGRLVTTGTINLGQNCTMEADAATEAALADIFASEGTILNNIFKNAELTVDFMIDVPASDLVDLSGMVSYENWRKIE